MIDIKLKEPYALMHEKLIWLKHNGDYEHEKLPGILTKEMVGHTCVHPISERQNIGPTDYYIVNQNTDDEFHIYDWMIASAKQHAPTLKDVDDILKGI